MPIIFFKKWWLLKIIRCTCFNLKIILLVALHLESIILILINVQSNQNRLRTISTVVLFAVNTSMYFYSYRVRGWTFNGLKELTVKATVRESNLNAMNKMKWLIWLSRMIMSQRENTSNQVSEHSEGILANSLINSLANLFHSLAYLSRPTGSLFPEVCAP